MCRRLALAFAALLVALAVGACGGSTPAADSADDRSRAGGPEADTPADDTAVDSAATANDAADDPPSADPMNGVTEDEANALEEALHGDEWQVHDELVRWCTAETLRRAQAAGKMPDDKFAAAMARIDIDWSKDTAAFLDARADASDDELQNAVETKVQEHLPDWTCEAFELPPAR